jgi:HrpA-like RNA helicase
VKKDGEESRGGREVCESWECDDEEEALKEEAAVVVKESWDSDEGGGISDDMLNQPKPSNSTSPEEGGGETRAEEGGGGRTGKEEEEGERKGQVAYEGGSKQTRIMEESVKMKAAWECVKRTGAWQAVWEQRKTLPIHKEAEAILAAIDTCPCVVLVGETGCGKSTQVAQMILDAALQRGEAAACRIICTQVVCCLVQACRNTS